MSRALRGGGPLRLRCGLEPPRRGSSAGRCRDRVPTAAVVADSGVAGREPGLAPRPVRGAVSLCVTSSSRRKAGWLIGEQTADGQLKYYWSNFGLKMPLDRLVEYAHLRHGVEQYHQEAKGLLGWDQYQGRLWPGFHRHAVTVMLAYSFLVWREWRQRQQRTRPGRRRRARSPTGPASGVTAGGPSTDLRLAPPPSGQGVAVA